MATSDHNGSLPILSWPVKDSFTKEGHQFWRLRALPVLQGRSGKAFVRMGDGGNSVYLILKNSPTIYVSCYANLQGQMFIF